MEEATRQLGMLRLHQGDYAAARALLEESLVLARELGNQGRIALILAALGEAAGHTGDFREARRLCGESLRLMRQQLGENDISNIREAQCWMLKQLGRVARLEGDLLLARSFLEEDLDLSRAVDSSLHQFLALSELGAVALGEGEIDEAADRFRESLSLLQASGNRHRAAEVLENVAGFLAKKGPLDPVAEQRRMMQAARLLGAAEALRKALGAPLPPAERTDYDRTVATVRAALAANAFARARAQGRMETLEQAIGLALHAAVRDSMKECR